MNIHIIIVIICWLVLALVLLAIISTNIMNLLWHRHGSSLRLTHVIFLLYTTRHGIWKYCCGFSSRKIWVSRVLNPSRLSINVSDRIRLVVVVTSRTTYTTPSLPLPHLVRVPGYLGDLRLNPPISSLKLLFRGYLCFIRAVPNPPPPYGGLST